MIDLYSVEAEEKILGFLYNSAYTPDRKMAIVAIISGKHFVEEKHSFLYEQTVARQTFDKIVLWEAIKMMSQTKSMKMEWKDLYDIDEFVSLEEAESYAQILQDKYERRTVYEYGKSIQDAMVKGKDQFEIALEAQDILSKLSSKLKVESNQTLLEKVLSESRDNVISTGYKYLDKFLGGYSRGMIVTIAGDSGHLKTTFALDKAFKMATANPDLRVGIFSKEMLAEDLMKKQISRICGIPISTIFSQEYDKEMVKEKMKQVEPWHNNRIQIINPNLFSGVTDIARVQMTHRYDIWFLDFIQLLEFSKAASTSSDYNIQIGQNMRRLQALALATGSVGVILSQVKKGIEKQSVMKPTVSDIEWSGLIKQLSTYIFFSYYPGKYYGFDRLPDDRYFLLGEKTRFAETFAYPMKVDPQLGLFHELDSVEARTKLTQELRDVVGRV
jgi:replicative DNA helicase